MTRDALRQALSDEVLYRVYCKGAWASSNDAMPDETSRRANMANVMREELLAAINASGTPCPCEVYQTCAVCREEKDGTISAQAKKHGHEIVEAYRSMLPSEKVTAGSRFALAVGIIERLLSAPPRPLEPTLRTVAARRVEQLERRVDHDGSYVAGELQAWRDVLEIEDSRAAALTSVPRDAEEEIDANTLGQKRATWRHPHDVSVPPAEATLTAADQQRVAYVREHFTPAPHPTDDGGEGAAFDEVAAAPAEAAAARETEK